MLRLGPWYQRSPALLWYEDGTVYFSYLFTHTRILVSGDFRLYPELGRNNPFQRPPIFIELKDSEVWTTSPHRNQQTKFPRHFAWRHEYASSRHASTYILGACCYARLLLSFLSSSELQILYLSP